VWSVEFVAEEEPLRFKQIGCLIVSDVRGLREEISEDDEQARGECQSEE
jgi:hypothetical protein